MRVSIMTPKHSFLIRVCETLELADISVLISNDLMFDMRITKIKVAHE